MEDLESPEVEEWIAAQNDLSTRYLSSLPLREWFEQRITELWNYPKVSLPAAEAGTLFYQRNSGLQKQAPVHARAGLSSPAVPVLDPNALSDDGSTALMAFAPSPDARLLAYALSEGGADWQTVHVRDLATGRDLDDRVRWMRFSDISWTKDGAGFFYSRFPEPPGDKVYEAALSGHALYYHRIGTDQRQDRLIFERPDLPSWFVGGTVTSDGRYLLITLSEGATNDNRLYFVDLGNPQVPVVEGPVQPLLESDGAEHAPIGNAGSLLFVRTDRDAPRRAVIAVSLANPAAAPRTVLAEGPHALGNVALAGGLIVAEYLVDVLSRLQTFELDGRPAGEVDLPGPGAVAGMIGRIDDPTAWVLFTSPVQPTAVFALDAGRRTLSPFEPVASPVDLSQFETVQRFATSRDGTRIPFFVTARRGRRRDGPAPLLLYGYGGFSVNLLPSYRPDVPAWLEMGGIHVTANIRGGAEYGEAWHRAGMRAAKQRVFDDFISVAEQLIGDGDTSPASLAIMGGSNGGLLVAAVMEQRPDLFAAVLPAVGVLDMLRYDRFTGGRAWVTEYGTATDPSDFPALLAYSPLHNIVPGTRYPAVLVTTADRDDRVVPSHSFKFVAALQRAQAAARPVLIRVETRGSHGYRPTDRRIAELADQWAFAAEHTKMRSLTKPSPASTATVDGAVRQQP
jgi:prolyl oligopeptidase